MHVGMAAIFQNPGKAQTDRDVYRERAAPRRPGRAARLRVDLGRRAPLHRLHDVPGRAAVPHLHGRPHAARVQLGSMVVVLPWHDPMRVAEQVVDARQHVGRPPDPRASGRGAGKVEFDGFRLSMDESRPRFVESRRDAPARARDAATASTTASSSSSRARRSGPRPFKSFRGRTYAAAVSPESVRDHGRARRRHPDHPAEAVGGSRARSSTTYRERLPPGERRRRAAADLGGLDVLRRERRARAEEMARRYIGGYYQTVLDHYQFQGDHLAKTKGYEYYGKMAEKIHAVRRPTPSSTSS